MSLKAITPIMKNLFLLFMFFSLSSCYLSIPKENRECYKQLKEFAKHSWVRDSNNLILPTRETYDFCFGKLAEFDCAKKLNQGSLIKLFGKPNEINSGEHKWYYFISSDGGVNFNFYFNPEGELLGIANDVALYKEILVSPENK